jgi:6-phosphogluconolactonase
VTSRPEPQLQCFADAETLARHAAQWLCNRAVASAGRFAVCLSGGSTPRRLYELLADPPTAAQMPWERVHWFFGDERFVPPDHPDSNFRMAHEALFARVSIPQQQIHPIPTQAMTPEQAASAYEATLKRYYGRDTLEAGHALFDATLLGLGEDGHTASLFPRTAALAEDRRWVVAVTGVKREARITLTYPALNNSVDVAFLVAGQAKRAILARVQAGDPDLPALAVRPPHPPLWLVDRAAWPD